MQIVKSKTSVQRMLEETLEKVGVKARDIILVHLDSTAIRTLSGLAWKDVFNLLKQCFLNVLGENGTLIVPTFNWDFCKGKAYIHEKTRSQVGMFTNYILFDQASVRSFHPIYSFAAIGNLKCNILNDVPTSSFGNDSVFYRLHQANAKIVLFNFELGSTFVHYVEQKHGVEYRYIKYFTGKVFKNNIEYEKTYDMYVRYLDREIEINFSKLHEYLISINKLYEAHINNQLHVKQFSCHDVYDAVMQKLDEDPYFLLEYPPKNINKLSLFNTCLC